MLPSLLLCTALALPATASAPRQDAPQAKEEKKEGKSIAKLERALDSARRKVRQAEMELALNEGKSEDAVMRAELDVKDKERAYDVAKRELEIYEELEARASLASAETSLDRAKSRLISEKQDLEGILRIYADEEEATAKGEIIRRHEVAVEFAEREVVAASARLEKARADVSLSSDKKRWATERASVEVRLSKRALSRAQLSAEISAAKAKDALQSAEEGVKDAEEALAAATKAKAEESK